MAVLKERLRSSMWLAPALSATAAIVGARLLVRVDRTIEQGREAWFLFGGEAENARDLLSLIASSMITLTGVVFSITILILQLASNQFSPRVLRTFLEDRATQAAMATFVGTFVYAIALLPAVRARGNDGSSFVPALSVFVAFTLVILSVGVLIHYLNHMAHSVRAVTIIKRVAKETRRAVIDMYPDEFVDGADKLSDAPTQDSPPTMVVPHTTSAGVLSSVDEEALMRAARATNSVVRLLPMLGDFVPRGAPLVHIWCAEPRRWSESMLRSLREAIFVGDERTPHQDPLFGFRQLVDIAERALSPGVNDPSTAVQALDEIHDLLRFVSRRRFPSPARLDEAGRLRLILSRPGWNAYVHLGLDEIRQYGARSVQVLRRMRELLEDCLAAAPIERREPFEKQLALLEQATQRGMPTREERTIAQQGSAQGHGEQ